MGETAAAYWDRHVGHHINSFVQWDACAPVRRHQWRLVTGDADTNPVA